MNENIKILLIIGWTFTTVPGNTQSSEWNIETDSYKWWINKHSLLS